MAYTLTENNTLEIVRTPLYTCDEKEKVSYLLWCKV